MLWWLKIRRFISAGSSVALVLLIPVAALAISMLGKIGATPNHPGSVLIEVPEGWMITVAVIGGGLALVVGLVEMFMRYRVATYDPTWALKYSDMFIEMTRDRSRAATVLLECSSDKLAKIEEFRVQLGDIDDVLDLFDDIGLYVRGGQISPELAAHYFYHWIRGYYQASNRYIKAWQQKEKQRWCNIEFLWKVVLQVEEGLWGTDDLSPKELEAFLTEEVFED